MPRRIIPFAPDTYYHIYNRGNNREAIFFETDNYLYFLRKIRAYLLPVADVLVYCLMPTHYHIVAQVRGATQTSEVSETSEVLDVSNAMMKLSISYTKAINKRFGRTGVLFQGQFHAKPVLNQTYLLNLCRYIHANPVKDEIVAIFPNGSIPITLNGLENATGRWSIVNLSASILMMQGIIESLFWNI